MEKDNFLDKLKKLVEVAKTKHNALDITEINDFFKGENLSPEKMEQIYRSVRTDFMSANPFLHPTPK